MEQGDVQVWLAWPRAAGPLELAAMALLLGTRERVRAAALRFEADRRAFVVAHALRRIAVADALGAQPQQLAFEADPHGQPMLRWPAAPDLRFSLSRGRGLVACATARGGLLGIDVEPHAVQGAQDMALLPPFIDLAHEECGAFEFSFAWTALEAYWKARGTGLTGANPRLRLAPFQPGVAQAHFIGDSAGASRLFMHALPAPAGFAATLACSTTRAPRMRAWDGMAAQGSTSFLNADRSAPCSAAPAAMTV